MQLAPGTTFGRYVIETVLGQGGMGRVFRAQDTVLERPVALKIILPDRASREEALARFLREAKVAAKITHPNTVQVYDLGMVDDVAFIAMELVEGRTLFSYLGDDSVSPERKLRWMIDAARGLAAAHSRHLLHRDVKPANVLVSNDGIAKLADFGLAKRTETTAEMRVTFHTGLGYVLGTPAYMAPEQLEGEEGIDARADQFSWALTTYAVLLGQNPRLADPLLQLPLPLVSAKHPTIPRAAAEIVLRALSNDRDMRFATMDELVVEIEAALARGVSLVPASPSMAPAPSVVPVSSARASVPPSDPDPLDSRIRELAAAMSRNTARLPWDERVARIAGFHQRVIVEDLPSQAEVRAERWSFTTVASSCPIAPIRRATFTPDGTRIGIAGEGGVGTFGIGGYHSVDLGSLPSRAFLQAKPLDDGSLLVIGPRGFVGAFTPSGRCDTISTSAHANLRFLAVDGRSESDLVFVGGNADLKGVVARFVRGRLEAFPTETPMLEGVAAGEVAVVSTFNRVFYALSLGVTEAVAEPFAATIAALEDDTVAIGGAENIALLSPLAGTWHPERKETSAVVSAFAGSRREAWAFDEQGKCHRRVAGGVWVMLFADLSTRRSKVVGAWAAPGRLRIVLADGTFLEGRRTGG